MPTHVLVVFYSTYGHVHQMAKAVEEGAKQIADAEVRLRRIPELEEFGKTLSGNTYYQEERKRQKNILIATHDDLRWAHGICWGTPTRYGNMAAQVKAFIDTTAGLWVKAELENKAAGVFTSTATIHGGQETTITTTFIPLLHLGMILVGTPYGENPHLLTTDGIGGSPYGPATLAGPDNARQPEERELLTARNLGDRVARVAARLKDLAPKTKLSG